MSKELLSKYAKLKIEIAKLENELEFLQPEVLKAVQAIKGDTDQPVELSHLPGYSFNVSYRKTWNYTERVKAKEIELQTLKATEEATGAADYYETPQLRFNKPRE